MVEGALLLLRRLAGWRRLLGLGLLVVERLLAELVLLLPCRGRVFRGKCVADVWAVAVCWHVG